MAFKFDFAVGGDAHHDTATDHSVATGHASDGQDDGPGTQVVLASSVAAVLGHAPQLQQHDVVAGEYEGGFKLWEGGVDLAAHVASEWDVGRIASTARLANQRVLELGCGAGLPGIVAMLAGADVLFQDYNAPVLQHVTMPNVRANSTGEPVDAAPWPRYVAGSWATLPGWLHAQGLQAAFDLVLTAETIYDPASIPTLLKCITTALKPGTGTCLAAAKSYYFGVGGSTAALRQHAAAVGLAVQQAAVLDDGASNKREILALTWA